MLPLPHSVVITWKVLLAEHGQDRGGGEEGRGIWAFTSWYYICDMKVTKVNGFCQLMFYAHLQTRMTAKPAQEHQAPPHPHQQTVVTALQPQVEADNTTSDGCINKTVHKSTGQCLHQYYAALWSGVYCLMGNQFCLTTLDS